MPSLKEQASHKEWQQHDDRSHASGGHEANDWVRKQASLPRVCGQE